MNERARLAAQNPRPPRPLPTGAVERGRLPRPPRAVLFDVYGTLLVHRREGGRAAAARWAATGGALARERDAAALEAALAAGIAEEHRRLRAAGLAHPEVRIEETWRRIFPGRSPGELRTAIVAWECAVNPAAPMPGAARLLAFLRGRGAVLGIVSNAQFYTPILLAAALGGAGLDALGFSPELCLLSYQHGIAKPEPGFFLLARERISAMGIAPGEAVMVGNSMAEDVGPAAGAGFMTVLAALDKRSFDGTGGSGAGAPDAVVTRLARLAVLVDRAGPAAGPAASPPG
jgi:putative hydrolase of the HAD superfamily